MITFLKPVDAGTWLATHFGDIPLPNATSVTWRVPSDSGRKTALARALLALIDDGNDASEAALVITGHGVWPSSENPTLFDGYRQSLGEARPVDEVPGHIFCSSDHTHIEGLLDLILYFAWDAVLTHPNSKLFVALSHDEALTVHSVDKSGVDDATALLSPICGQPI